jgi:membrane protein DedA with SNARE-associated domain
MPSLPIHEWIKILGALYDQYGYLVRVANLWSTSKFGLHIRLAGRLRLGRMLLKKHGGKAILISHLIGHLRSFVALSAGLTQMRYLRFLAFELVAAIVWNTAFCLLGYFIAGEIERLQMMLERSGWVIPGILLLLLLAWRIYGQRAKQRIRRERRQARRRVRSMVLR